MLVWLDRGSALGNIPWHRVFSVKELVKWTGLGTRGLDQSPKWVGTCRHYLSYMVVWFYMGFEAQLRCHLLHVAFPALKWNLWLLPPLSTPLSLMHFAICFASCIISSLGISSVSHSVLAAPPWGHPRPPRPPAPLSGPCIHRACLVHIGWNENQIFSPFCGISLSAQVIIICARFIFLLGQRLANFFCKGHIGNAVGFVAHTVYVTRTQICC